MKPMSRPKFDEWHADWERRRWAKEGWSSGSTSAGGGPLAGEEEEAPDLLKELRQFLKDDAKRKRSRAAKKTAVLARADAAALLQRTRKNGARAKSFAARALSRYPAREICRVRCRARYIDDTREAANCHSAHASSSRALSFPAALPPAPLHLRPFLLDAKMPPRRRSSSGYRGVRKRPSGRVDAEIRSGEERIPFRVEWARRFPEDVAATAAFYAEKEKKEEEKAAAKAAKKASREKRRAEIAKRRAAKAARKAEEKKNGAGPSTVVVSSSSSFEWTTTPVSSTTPSSSDFNWDSSE
nr:uncharacterized protein LOC127303480 [Lolium perenne]